MAKKNNAIPQTYEQGEWTVRTGPDNCGAVSFIKREMLLPDNSDSEEAERAIRTHEYGHIMQNHRIDTSAVRREFTGVDPFLLNSLMDLDCNDALYENNIDDTRALPMRDHVQIETDKPLAVADIVSTALRDIATAGEFRNPDLTAPYHKAVNFAQSSFTDLRRRIRDSGWDIDRSTRVFSEYVREFLEMVEMMAGEIEREKEHEEEITKLMEARLSEGIGPEASMPDHGLSGVLDGHYGYTPPDDYVEEVMTNQWGEMYVRTMELESPYNGKIKKYRPSVYGVLARPWNVLSGDTPFRMRRRIAGGTVLIDGSGSMQIREDQLAAILDAKPAATVAIYSGLGTQGHLTILAQNMKRCNMGDYSACGSGNIVDGPALIWLSKQEAPRIWVCDGRVTGKNDHPARNLSLEAFRIARAIRAKRFGSVGSYLEALNNVLKPQYRSSSPST